MLPVEVGKRSVQFLVSGSAATVISPRIYELVKEEAILPLEASKLRLCTASGQSLDILGILTLELKIGKHGYLHDVVVGDIGNSDGILGTDFLEKYSCLLDVAKGTLRVDNHTVKLKREVTATCARVQARETVVVPPRSEKFVKSSLVQCDFGEQTECLLEGDDDFCKYSSLEIPRCLVLVNRDELCVPVTNFSDNKIFVHVNTVIASVDSAVSLSNNQSSDASQGKSLSELPDHLELLLTKVSSGQ